MLRLSALSTLSILLALPAVTAPVPATSDAGGVLSGLTIASFTGSGQTSIQAVATDSSGNIYVTGTTSSTDFPVKNAAQPVFGESRILRSTDLGPTWDFPLPT
jgi:Beta-propeller repeat